MLPMPAIFINDKFIFSFIHIDEWLFDIVIIYATVRYMCAILCMTYKLCIRITQVKIALLIRSKRFSKSHSSITNEVLPRLGADFHTLAKIKSNERFRQNVFGSRNDALSIYCSWESFVFCMLS